MWAFYQSSLPVAFWQAGRTDKKKRHGLPHLSLFFCISLFSVIDLATTEEYHEWEKLWECSLAVVFLGTTLPFFFFFFCFGSKIWFKWGSVASQGCQLSSPPHLSPHGRCELVHFVLALNLAGLLHIVGPWTAVLTGSGHAICRWAVRNCGRRVYCADYYM